MQKQPITIDIGGETRTLRVDGVALRAATMHNDGRDPRQQLEVGNPTLVYTCAAAALIHQLKDKASPARVSKWIDDDPAKYLELAAKTIEAFRRYYVAIGLLEDNDEGKPSAPGE